MIESPDSLRMRIDGDVWQVVGANKSTVLAPGVTARVVGYDSIILKVEPVKE
ncbi:MAG: NfeD family protein [Muribaculaceae bacterium]|nr:NfeD family protein [Muribaculaceae bacterium]